MERKTRNLNNVKPHGFKRQLEADKIIGTTKSNGELLFLMKW